MNDRDQEQKDPSEPSEDPKVKPTPPGNPDVDEEAVRKGEEKLDGVSGH